MEDRTLTLFKDIPTKQNKSTPRKPVPEIEAIDVPFDNLGGKRIVVTGNLFRMQRDEFKSFLLDRGAKMLFSVSNNTDLLVVGESPGGTKLTKAKELSVPICYESDFFDKFGSQLTLGI